MVSIFSRVMSMYHLQMKDLVLAIILLYVSLVRFVKEGFEIFLNKLVRITSNNVFIRIFGENRKRGVLELMALVFS